MRCRDAAKTALSSHDDCGEQYQLAIEMSIGYLGARRTGETLRCIRHRTATTRWPRFYRVPGELSGASRVTTGIPPDPEHHSDPTSLTSGSDSRLRCSISTADINVNSNAIRPEGVLDSRTARIFMAAAELMGRDVQPDSWVVLGGCATLLSRATPCVTAQCRASFGIISSGSFSVDFRKRCLLLALIVPHVKRPQARRTTELERDTACDRVQRSHCDQHHVIRPHSKPTAPRRCARRHSDQERAQNSS
jgi:hypothetical protein